MIARIWTLDAIPNDRLGVKNDDWVVGENGKLMKWVPKNLRTHPCGHRYISMPNHSFYFRLRYVTVWNGISCCLMFDLYLASPASYFGRVYWNECNISESSVLNFFDFIELRREEVS